jgi:hypothetical protein
MGWPIFIQLHKTTFDVLASEHYGPAVTLALPNRYILLGSRKGFLPHSATKNWRTSPSYSYWYDSTRNYVSLIKPSSSWAVLTFALEGKQSDPFCATYLTSTLLDGTHLSMFSLTTKLPKSGLEKITAMNVFWTTTLWTSLVKICSTELKCLACLGEPSLDLWLWWILIIILLRHDVAMQVVGQPARDLARHFVQRCVLQWKAILIQSWQISQMELALAKQGLFMWWRLISKCWLWFQNHKRLMPFLMPPPEFRPGELTQLGLTGTCEMQICRSAGPWSMGTPNRIEHSIQNAYLKGKLSDAGISVILTSHCSNPNVGTLRLHWEPIFHHLASIFDRLFISYLNLCLYQDDCQRRQDWEQDRWRFGP